MIRQSARDAVYKVMVYVWLTKNRRLQKNRNKNKLKWLLDRKFTV
jgi:hypothetical protein